MTQVHEARKGTDSDLRCILREDFPEALDRIFEEKYGKPVRTWWNPLVHESGGLVTSPKEGDTLEEDEIRWISGWSEVLYQTLNDTEVSASESAWHYVLDEYYSQDSEVLEEYFNQKDESRGEALLIGSFLVGGAAAARWIERKTQEYEFMLGYLCAVQNLVFLGYTGSAKNILNESGFSVNDLRRCQKACDFMDEEMEEIFAQMEKS